MHTRWFMKEVAAFPARYKNRNEEWEGWSDHIQVESGLGFTCDRDVLDLVLSLNFDKIQTLGSCQGPYGQWIFPRAWVRFYGETDRCLMSFCLALKEQIFNLYGRDFTYECHIHIDNFCDPREFNFADLTVPQKSVAQLVEAIHMVRSALFPIMERITNNEYHEQKNEA